MPLFYPKMSSVVRDIMEKIETETLSRRYFQRNHEKLNIARRLVWDGWVRIEPDENYDLRLTADGKVWLERERIAKTGF